MYSIQFLLCTHFPVGFVLSRIEKQTLQEILYSLFDRITQWNRKHMYMLWTCLHAVEVLCEERS